MPSRCQNLEVTPGVLVLLNGLKERLEVSCPKTLEGKTSRPTWLIKQKNLLFFALQLPSPRLFTSPSFSARHTLMSDCGKKKILTAFKYFDPFDERSGLADKS